MYDYMKKAESYFHVENLMDMENIIIKMEDISKANGKMIKKMEKENLLGQMKENTKEILKMIK